LVAHIILAIIAGYKSKFYITMRNHAVVISIFIYNQIIILVSIVMFLLVGFNEI
jgi:hypothetical protein